MLQESTAQRGSFASANILNDLELQVMDQFKSFYTEIEQTTIEQVRYKPTSLEDAEQQFEKTYLQQQLADNKGIQSRVGNYRTIHRLAQKHDLEAKAFDLVTFSNATQEQKERLEGIRADVETKLYAETNATTPDQVRESAYQVLEQHKESNPEFYALVKNTLDQNIDSLTRRINYNKKVINLNTIIGDATQFSQDNNASVQEARDNFRSLLVAYTLYRNDGSIKATAEELDTSEKTVQRTVKKIKEKQVQLKDTFEQYITQDPKEFLADLHRVAFKQLTGQESPTSLN